MIIIIITIAEVTSIRSGLRKRKRAESPQPSEPQVSEEWVEEEKLDLWEIKLFGEKQEKAKLVSNARLNSQRQLESSNSIPMISISNIPSTKPSNEEIKETMEQQLKLQPVVHHQKKCDNKQPNGICEIPSITKLNKMLIQF